MTRVPLGGADELLADLAEARRAERLVASVLAEVREQLAATVVTAKAAGVGYDRMAQTTLRAVPSLNKTLARREREAARLRKLAHRYRVTKGHEYPAGRSTETRSQLPDFSVKEKVTMEKLIKRTTIEETFSVDGTSKQPVADDLDDRDDLEGDDDADEDDTAERKARRR